MALSRDAVRDYYEHAAEREWVRLIDPADGAIEFALHCHWLTSYVPAQARILDLGGGLGRYAIWLAQNGHRVVLADLSPALLAIARREIAAAGVEVQVEEVVEADACDLSCWESGSFDAVLCLGPFYHLTEVTDHARAATELARVLRSGGLVFVGLMPRLAFLRRTLALEDEQRHLHDPSFVRRLLEDGVFHNDVPGRFNAGYGVHPSEVSPFFESYGFRTQALLAAEGITIDMQQQLIALRERDPGLYARAFELIVRTASDPSILGLANHLLYIGEAAIAGIHDQ